MKGTGRAVFIFARRNGKEYSISMFLSRQEIIDFASRYVEPGEAVDFPNHGELFCLIGRDLPDGKILTDEEGWSFQGYSICLGYTLDNEAVPPGKWLWMQFASLAAFPPQQQVLKLQPPHVVRGRFQNPDRTKEFRILKISLLKSPEPAEARNHGAARPPSKTAGSSAQGNIVQFRPKKAT
jgi:hypothetical protein